MNNLIKQVYTKAKAWDNYLADVENSVREVTGNEDEVKWHVDYVINEYMEDKQMNNLNIKLLSDNATTPTRANPTDSGLDLYVSETVNIPPRTTKLVKTDIAIELLIGYEGQVRPRSGTSLKTKLRVALGTIDQTYHKEIGIITDNISDKPITVQKGQRLAQLVIAPVIYTDVNVVKEFEYVSDRSGYGSTGE